MSTLPQVSIIIPFAPEDMAWKALLTDLEKLPASAEIILVAASEKAKQDALDSTLPANASVICSDKGRGLQMNAGARAAKNPCLWFLHADSRLDTNGLKAIDAFDFSKKKLGYFGLRFQDDGPRRMRINSLGVWLRSRFLGIPFGDQGFV
ncbi:MAG: glycosyl transferase family 2, partial [Arenimonas sp.]